MTSSLPGAMIATTPKAPSPPAILSGRAKRATKPRKSTPAPTLRGEGAIQLTKPKAQTPPLLDVLRVHGRNLDDLEHTRIVMGNRNGALQRRLGIESLSLEATITLMEEVEHKAKLALVREWRKHPLAPWAKSRRGLGELSLARLLAEIGDPLVGSIGHWETVDGGAIDKTKPSGNTLRLDRLWIIDSHYERTVGQLWQYAGVGDPARSKIPKGATQEEIMARGKPRAKKQLYLIAESMLRAGNRETYDARRAVTADRIHKAPCAQCHAKAGDPWKDGHKHADALRIVGKKFLRDLYVAARAVRGGHKTHETQS